MEPHRVFCPLCSRDVTITTTAHPLHGQGQATIPDGGEVVCLDFGPRCTQDRCAVANLPRVVMGVRLARSGMRRDDVRTVRALCDGCAELQALEIIDDSRAYCPACGTVNLWAMVRLDGEEWLALTGHRAEAELG